MYDEKTASYGKTVSESEWKENHIFMKNERSFLKSLILGYLIVTVIAVLAIVLLNIYSQEIFRGYILESNENKLEKMTLHVEAVLSEMQETCVNVSLDTEIQDAMSNWTHSKKEDAYDKFLMNKSMKAYNKEKFFDIFIYFIEDHSIVSSSQSSLSIDAYYKTYFSRDGEAAAGFAEALACEKEYSGMGSICADNGDVYVYYAMKNPVFNNKTDYVTCVMLRPESISELLRNITSGSDVALFDRDKQLLARKGEKEIAYTLDGYDGMQEMYEIDIEDERYIMQVREFQNVAGFLGSATPTRLFWQRFQEVRTISFLCIAVFVLIEGIIVYLYSKRQERPLSILARDLQQGFSSENPGEQKDNALYIKEFSFIRDMFLREHEEKRELYEVVEHTKKDSKKFLLRRLLEGVDIEQIEKDSILPKSGIDFVTNLFVVGVIRLEQSALEKEAMQYQGGKIQEHKTAEISEQAGNVGNTEGIYIVRNVFEELFRCGYVSYMVQPEKNQCVFILNLRDEKDANKIISTLEEGKLFLASAFDIQTTISYSTISEGLQEISTAYTEARQAMEYRYLFGKGSIIFYEDIADRGYVYSDNKKFLPIMEAYINGNKRQEYTAKHCVDELLALSKINQSVSMKTAENFELQVMQALHAVMMDNQCSTQQKKEFVTRLLDRETLEEFLISLAVILEALQKSGTVKEDERDICTHARRYIQAHFSDSQLGVGNVAEAVGMSASYLSKMYKSKFGVSIAQDIANVRMQEAKRLLLQEADMNINVIAEKTGFSTNIVFARAFKAAEGITPGEFRRQEQKR